MYISSGTLLFSASDLSNYLGCRHLSQLDRAVANRQLDSPTWRDPRAVQRQQRGLAHEEAYVDHLRAQGLHIVDLRNVEEGASALEKTSEAMRQGVDGIVQAALRDGCWGGRADVLRKVEEHSAFGPWSYEVVDTKLAQQTRGGTILQLALYSDLLSRLIGSPSEPRHPEHMHVVKPGPDFPQETFRWNDFAATFRRLRQDFEQTLQTTTLTQTYPLPVPQCDICRWWSHCNEQRHTDDHLSLVAGMRNLHISELEHQGITTLEDFATRDPPIAKPRQGSLETYERLHRQASVQWQGRCQKEPFYELRPLSTSQEAPTPFASSEEPARGLGRLPAPSPGDIFFDFEGDPFVDPGGLEYLFGFAMRPDQGSSQEGTLEYRALWALDRTQEQQAFEDFIDFLMARLDTYPDFHVYHFASYEPSTLKRLMGRYGSREEELDRLLRGERFVDLHAVTRQGLWASVERYSLKDLEPFYGFHRDLDLRDASTALRHVDWALELGSLDEITDQDRQQVELYNCEDCLSTAALQDWLEDRRRELIESGQTVPRPETPEDTASEELQEQQAQVKEVFDALMSTLPQDGQDLNDEDRACALLAHLLDYFRREDKSAWWEFFRLRDLDEEQLLDERKAVSGLVFEDQVPSTSGRLPVHRYRFPEQEAAVRAGHKICAPGGIDIGTVEAIDGAGHTIDIRKMGKTVALHPLAVFTKDIVRPRPLDTSLLALARSVVAHGIDVDGPYRAARDLLLRRPPRRAVPPPTSPGDTSLRHPDEPILDAAQRLVSELDGGVLPIQGPPGTGKTYIGARLIVELMRRGKKVGVTAVSHKVIRNLLEKTLEAANEQNFDLEVAHKPGSKKPGERHAELPVGLVEMSKNDQALACLGDKVLGATAWLWANDAAVESVDVLVVDEAGQMSLAQVLAASRSARNLVLLGDPQQLEQPQRGTHPDGADAAALEHLLGGHQTLPTDSGLFLDTTWRMSPQLCEFTSELYYEDRLDSHASLSAQGIETTHPFTGGGLFYAPVTHHGNQATSPEEVDAVAHWVDRLLQPEATYIDRDEERHPLTPQDILVVAPFNAHVGALSQRLPELRIGTVDRFQGQEAPVVIYSLASSSVEEAPRGMTFLLDPHRLNVATSRARCIVILVASPRLFEAECRTPEAMRWLNGLCRFRELASELEP